MIGLMGIFFIRLTGLSLGEFALYCAILVVLYIIGGYHG